MKKLRIFICVIVAVAVAGFAIYKVAYNTLAPMVFDYIVEKNPEAILGLGGGKLQKETSEADKETDEPVKNEETKKEEENTEKEEKNEPKEEEKQDESTFYSTNTSIGTLTTADLARVLKRISPADKTRIISICKSAVAAKDMPRFAKMAKGGMTSADYAYAESYLRASLSASQKQEILNIVKKYL